MKKIDLAGTWQLSSTDGRYQFSDAKVPGTVLYQIELAGEYGKEDVFFRENNRRCVDIVDREFLFQREFNLPEDFIGPDRKIFFEADGLDTLAHIRLNSSLVGYVENMHRKWTFNINDKVKKGSNQLSIQFDNAVKEAERRQKIRPLWQVKSPLPGAMHLRKNFCSFGWDWGPQMPDVGIYRDICIKSYLGAKLNSVDIRQIHSNGQVTLKVTPDIDRWANVHSNLRLVLKSPEGIEDHYELLEGKTTDILIKNPKLWWPNGYGDQPLYQIQVTLTQSDQGELIDQMSCRIGLRTLRLERNKDQWGESFQFSVNGVPLFARGANYIPEDVYLTRVTPEKTFALIHSAKLANFNCMRVWGGGVYPNHHFFDACDENGIIVWQDLMFSCAIYDIHNPVFYENITQEVRQNLTRIRHHASLGLICGNNEMEWGFEHWGFPHTKENRVEYLKQYEILFPRLVSEICPDVDYWPASPSSGGHFDEPNHPDKGDVHFWDVWHGRKNYTEFRKHHFRFLSEFGFQSFPNIKTIESYTLPEDRNIFSPVMEDHQRNDSDNGNAKIFHFISDYYRYPKDLGNLVYVSQLSQGEALRYAVEHLRQNRGRCMGATYWQFNDNWPVASWSSVDYFGRWKAMHYVAKRVYAGLLLSVREEGHLAKIFLCNEGREAFKGHLNWKLITFNGQVIRQGHKTVEIPALSSVCSEDLDFSQELVNLGDRERYLSVDFQDSLTGKKYRCTTSFVPYKHLNLPDPKLTWTLVPESGGSKLTIKANAFAKFVEIDFKDYDCILEDNYFDLDAGESRSMVIHGPGIDQIRVRSLKDSF